ncbi:MAG: TlpA disulfide reductase family protein [Maribacter sp.]|jgi:thiol-disulfide isomerase/thioredoxin
MKYTLPLLAIGLLMLLFSCKPIETDPNATIEIFETFSELQAVITDEDHEVTVLNFWSTTCAPCLKEMPHFNDLEIAYRDKKVKIFLVNLEKKTRLDSHIYPFVQKLGIIPEVVVLTDPNYNVWTDNIDDSWYGALPATFILKGDQRNFKFGSYKTYEELQADVERVLVN